MKAKTWLYPVIGFFLVLAGCGSSGGLNLAGEETNEATITISLVKGAAGDELTTDGRIVCVRPEWNVKWKRADDQDFSFIVLFPEKSPFPPGIAKKLKSLDMQDTAGKWHGIKHKVAKETPEGIYHYIVAAYYEGEIYIIDPEIIVPRPGKG
jgi:hypothetical protein